MKSVGKGYHAKASENPAKRLGIYKRISDVPQSRQLSTFSRSYEGRDVWGEWVTAEMDLPNRSESTQGKVARAEERWKAHTDDRDTHHALASPEDVETWLMHLLDERGFTLRTIYSSHFVYIENMFNWLTYRTDHPHTYNPAIMAAVAGGVTSEVWDFKTGYARRPEEYRRNERNKGEST